MEDSQFTPVHNKTCKVCGNTFYGRTANASLCSDECRTEQKYRNQQAFMKNKRESRPDNELVTCQICGERYGSLSGHLMDAHGITSDAYREKFPGAPVVSEALSKKFSENTKGENNPGYQHGGRLSPWSDKNQALSPEQVGESKRKAKAGYTPDKRSTRIEYWIARGYTEEEAKQKLIERQRTFTLEKCIEKHGEVKGRQVHAARQEKWNRSYKKSNYSKVSQLLFWRVYEQMTVHDVDDIFFAQFNRGIKQEDLSVNLEYTLRLGNTSVKPDFYLASQKKVIEFDGDYWHSDVHGGAERSRVRDQQLVEAGYSVLHIRECDYRSDPDLAVAQCVEFLNS